MRRSALWKGKTRDFGPIADKYWNARGGSHTDGGSFIFSLKDAADGSGRKKLICTDKFGKVIETPKDKVRCDISRPITITDECRATGEELAGLFSEEDGAVARSNVSVCAEQDRTI